MTELAFLENPQFIRMTVTIFGWLIAHIIIFIVAAIQGLQKDVLLNARNLSAKGKKIALAMKQDASINDLKRICYAARKGKAILEVYILENGDNIDVSTAINRLNKVYGECSDVARALRLGEKDSVKLESQDVVQVLSEAETILNKVLKDRENKRLMKV